ncbi:cytochrome c biogenesis protein CcsA [Catenovulum sp. 2E275]|uniref:cytochrome C assembly family protein n=1 Tax=Catenovulum sp. 2E275 TaxID=2980497 RepID=UPI0021D1565E|nr:cytochrome c biogenesis protein CcsA [Catenovulum sp. 2E275]MCU4675764.1 cytochrome c biogenesis protein CcsA [Catenovulum sp. 2E275]
MSFAPVAIGCYLVSSIGLLLALFNKRTINLLSLTTIGVFGLFFHSIFVGQHYQLNDEHAYSIILATNVVSATVTLIACMFAIYSRNYFALPVCLLFTAAILLLSLFIPIEQTSVTTWTVEMLAHISMAIISYGILLIATLLAMQYSIISGRLKHHDLSVLSLPMPSLDAIEKQIFTLLKFGLITLTISIATGFVFLEHFIGSGQAHKVVLTLLAWLCFMCILIGHLKLGWRGKRILVLSVTGSALLTLGYFGSRLIKEIILR